MVNKTWGLLNVPPRISFLFMLHIWIFICTSISLRNQFFSLFPNVPIRSTNFDSKPKRWKCYTSQKATPLVTCKKSFSEIENHYFVFPVFQFSSQRKRIFKTNLMEWSSSHWCVIRNLHHNMQVRYDSSFLNFIFFWGFFLLFFCLFVLRFISNFWHVPSAL